MSKNSICSKEDQFFTLLCAWLRDYPHYKLPAREFRFDDRRRWRFDVAWPDYRVAVELDGLVRGGRGGHQTIEGITRQHEKANAAVLAGWLLLRFTHKQAVTDYARRTIMDTLFAARCRIKSDRRPTGTKRKA